MLHVGHRYVAAVQQLWGRAGVLCMMSIYIERCGCIGLWGDDNLFDAVLLQVCNVKYAMQRLW